MKRAVVMDNPPVSLPPRRPRRNRIASWRNLSGPSLFLLGLILGLAGALYYTWVIDPVDYIDATPSKLSAHFQSEYIFLTSQSYAMNGDWRQTQRRLEALGRADIEARVLAELEDYMRRGGDDLQHYQNTRNLAFLARQLGVQDRAVDVFFPPEQPLVTDTPAPTTVASATPTLLPTLTPTPRPSITPRPTIPGLPTLAVTATPIPAFRLLSQQRACRFDAPYPVIEVVVLDAFLDEMPGIEVLVSWEEGEDHFFTGFKPEEGPGYGDFTMLPNISYGVEIAGGSPAITGLRVTDCQAEEGGFAGGWLLTFQNLTLDR